LEVEIYTSSAGAIFDAPIGDIARKTTPFVFLLHPKMWKKKREHDS
jgi:hypothetical protein